MSVEQDEVTVTTMTVGDFEYLIRVAGPDDGEPVVLLHGAPDTSFMWEPAMRVLAAAGYRSIAPDQRGYSPGARPAEVSAYGHRELGQDVLDIAAAAGMERFHLVAHDWGAGAAWCAVDLDRGTRVQSLMSLSIPHYRGFAQAAWEDPEGAHYRGALEAFLEPGKIEEAWSANDFAALRAIWSAHPEGTIEEYLKVFAEPGALTGVINWYRATDAHRKALDGTSLEFAPITIPTMLVWGSRDIAVKRLAVDLARPLIEGPYEYVELDAGHWLVAEESELISQLIVRQIRRHHIS